VNDRDLKRLDRREGVLVGVYTRGPVEVHNQDGQPAQTQTYFAVREREEDFTPHQDYIDLYLRGAKHFGLPAEYIESLDGVRKKAKSD
jgi:cation transport regulator ChaC